MILIGNIWAGLGGGGSVNITLTTDETGGASTLMGTTLNIPVYQTQIVFSTTGDSGPSTFDGVNLNIPVYQGIINLTTVGTSGAATFDGTTLNIPDYATGGGVVTLDNGLMLTGTNGQLGGVLIQNTLVTGNGNSMEFAGASGSHISEASIVINGTVFNALSYDGAGKRLGFIADSGAVPVPIELFDEVNTIGMVGAGNYSLNSPLQSRIDPLQYIQRQAVHYLLRTGNTPLVTGTQNFVSYTVPGTGGLGLGQVLRINSNAFPTSIAAADTLIGNVVYTDFGGVVRVAPLVTYAATGLAQTVPPVIIMAKAGTTVSFRYVATILTSYVAFGSIEYCADI